LSQRKKKKTYKTSSIPIVNTDGPKTKTNKKNFWSTRAVKKKDIFMHSEIQKCGEERRNLKAPKISA